MLGASTECVESRTVITGIPVMVTGTQKMEDFF